MLKPTQNSGSQETQDSSRKAKPGRKASTNVLAIKPVTRPGDLKQTQGPTVIGIAEDHAPQNKLTTTQGTQVLNNTPPGETPEGKTPQGPTPSRKPILGTHGLSIESLWGSNVETTTKQSHVSTNLHGEQLGVQNSPIGSTGKISHAFKTNRQTESQSTAH